MKVNIGAGQLFSAFRNARKALGSTLMLFNETNTIKLFEKAYDVKFVDNRRAWREDQLIFKSEEDYFVFLMTWS